MRSISKADLATDTDRMLELLTQLGKLQPLRDPIATAMEDYGFTPPQVHSLLWLHAERALTMGELARRIGITEKTVTGIVDRLERAKQVVRERDPKDRRVVHVKLTRTGTTVAAKMAKLVRAKVGLAMGLLDPSDRAALFRILEKFISRAQAARSSEEAHPA